MNTIESILSEQYGVGLLVASPCTVLWAAAQLAESVGVDAAKAALSAANRRREKFGYIPAYAPFHHPLF